MTKNRSPSPVKSSLCTINLTMVCEELERSVKPTTAVLQVGKMLCIFVEIFRDRSVHFLSSAESLLTWPQILQFIRAHMKQSAKTLSELLKVKTALNSQGEMFNLSDI